MLLIILLQLNTSIFLQTIGLSVIQAIFQAPIYGLAVYWGILFANKHLTKSNKNIELNELRNKLKEENK